MSYVTNIILTANYIPAESKRKIENLCHIRDSQDWHMGFTNIHRFAGGGKVFEGELLACAVNYLDGYNPNTSNWMWDLLGLLKNAKGVYLILLFQDYETICYTIEDGNWKCLYEHRE